MLPTVGADTIKTVRYAGEVGGRILGVAAMKNLVPDAARRASLEKSGNAALMAVKQLMDAHVARIVAEHIDQRVAFGKGRGVDRGFDAAVAVSSETIRTSLPDRGTSNPDYRAIFPNGTDGLTSPTIKEDEDIAIELRRAVADSSLAVKADVIALLDELIPVVGPAAKELRDSEKQVNALFQTELNGRKLVVDTLWEERKVVETALGRGGKGLARFIFFDFRKSGDEGGGEEVPIFGVPPIPSAPGMPVVRIDDAHRPRAEDMLDAILAREDITRTNGRLGHRTPMSTER